VFLQRKKKVTRPPSLGCSGESDRSQATRLAPRARGIVMYGWAFSLPSGASEVMDIKLGKVLPIKETSKIVSLENADQFFNQLLSYCVRYFASPVCALHTNY